MFNEFESEIIAILDQFKSDTIPLYFWLRDDDCIEVTENLNRLVRLTEKHEVPLSLAVIPENCREDLPGFLKQYEHIDVLQHGYAHINNSNADEKKCEFPSTLDASLIEKKISLGKEKLLSFFGSQLQPLFVPPWNRFPREFESILKTFEFQKISGYGTIDSSFHMDTQLDIIDWKNGKSCLSQVKAVTLFKGVLLEKSLYPMGLLTHHLVHTEPVWDFLDCILTVLKAYPNIHWVRSRDFVQ